ncbi:ankyrin repeat domain-containing protein 50 [Microdochium nivale]|nr:ankyrin repeat domain-containing protein 50 [Microdochium nivale]
MDSANSTSRQAFGSTEADNALLGNNFNGRTKIIFKGKPGELPRARAEKDACLRSLTFGEIHARRHDIAVASPDTCDWLFQTPEFRRWRNPAHRNTHYGVFWIKGKPGAGKSTLMKHAFSRFQKNDMFGNHLIVAHFFNARGFTLEKTFLGLLRSMVYQLVKDEKLYSLFEQLLLREKQLSSAANDLQWHLSELRDFVYSVVTRPDSRPLLLLVDALDECEESQAREMVGFLESLSEYAFGAGFPLHICLSSRHYPSIGIKKVVELEVEISPNHREAIAKYIGYELRIRDAAIEAEIIKRANSVFLWVVIVVSLLNKAYDEGLVEVMQKTLDEVPDELDKLFISILDTFSRAAKALPIFLWVLFSRRPLELRELFAAVFQEFGPSPIDAMKRRITTLSRGLVELRSGESKTVQFIHLSVEDFLYRQKRLSAIDPTLDPEPITISHGRLWARCWASIEQAVTTPMDKKNMIKVSQTDPFLGYAASYILHHADIALSCEMAKADQEDGSSRSSDTSQQTSIKEWLQKRDHWFQWWRMFLAVSDQCDDLDLDDEQGADFLYMAALFGLPYLLRASLAGSDINAKSGYYGTALGAASYRGNYHVALLLVENGADVNAQGGLFGNALQAASANGKQDIVQLLLEAGADVNAQGGEYGNALQAASWRGKQDIVQLLLEAGADVNAQGGRYGNALQAASANGKQDIVQLLLEAGADVNAQGGRYGNALQAASDKGHQDIVQLLLEAGADARARGGGEYSTALEAASAEGHQGTIQLRLDAGADVNARGGKFGNALKAAWYSTRRVKYKVKFLLGAGADVNA